jgi:exopolyphosphatase/guanosine-5'-triphosphate,3'-diphosphate pyrophosphatase
MLAALDLGSNSFHLLIADRVNGSFKVVERFSEKVQLGEGVAATGRINEAAMARAMDCLHNFRVALDRHPITALRAVGTKTFRTANNVAALLLHAERLGFAIEIISGEREAELIYRGVTYAMPSDDEIRLVVDIGGGSTEFALGVNHKPFLLRSLSLGCVTWRDRFFSSGKTDKEDFKSAVVAAREHIYMHNHEFRAVKWKRVYGSSGTAKMLSAMACEMDFSDGTLTLDVLKQIRDTVLAFELVKDIDLPGLKLTRQSLLLPGLAIMTAVLRELDINRMHHSRTALREGLLLELLYGAGQQVRLL